MRIVRWAACFDPHGSAIDRRVDAEFRRFVSWWRPHIRINGGDNWNFDGLRRNLPADESSDDLNADFAAGLDFMRWYRPTVFLEGNHDYRIEVKSKSNHGPTAALAIGYRRQIDDALRKMGTRTIAYCSRNGVYQLGDHKVLHGYAHGEACARHHAQAYGNSLFGHVHTFSEYTAATLERSRSLSVGCLCDLDHEYLRPKIGRLKHENGWVYGIVVQRKTVVWQARKCGQVWVYPSEFRLSNRNTK